MIVIKSIKTRRKYILVGSDFSAQEPRLFSAISGDDKMLDAFRNNRDIYATFGSGVYNCDYWDCVEHHEDGTANPSGKKKRKAMKGLYLGITYGMQIPSIAKKIGTSQDEAEKVLDDFYNGFKKAKQWIDSTKDKAHKLGYVEDLWGRRRRLPDIQLPKIEVKYSKLNSSEFNPFLGSVSIQSEDDALLNKYRELINKCKSRKDYYYIVKQAEKEGVYIKNNESFIESAERQCVNAVIQGSAATMSKKAMILLDKDEELKKYGFRMLVCVHDEIIGECLEDYAQECADRLTYIMSNCVPEVPVGFKCDPTIEYSWNEEDYEAEIQKEYNELVNSGVENAFDVMCEKHVENKPDKLKEYLQI